MKIIVLDSETDGWLENVTKLHVVAWTEDGENYNHTNDRNKIKEILLDPETLIVCHNAIRYDLPVFNKLLGTNLNYTKFIDTLALSWYLNFDRSSHGLESYGVDYGVPKPKVDDWEGLTKKELEVIDYYEKSSRL